MSYIKEYMWCMRCWWWIMWPCFFSAVLTICCRVLWSETVQFMYHMERQLVKMRSIVIVQKVVRMGKGSLVFFSLYRKWWCFCISWLGKWSWEVLCNVHTMNLGAFYSLHSCYVSYCAVVSGLVRLSQSWQSSLVLLTLKDILLSLNYPVSWFTAFLYAHLSLLLMRPTIVVSSANLMMWYELYFVAQSWVSRWIAVD